MENFALSVAFWQRFFQNMAKFEAALRKEGLNLHPLPLLPFRSEEKPIGHFGARPRKNVFRCGNGSHHDGSHSVLQNKVFSPRMDEIHGKFPEWSEHAPNRV